MTSEAMPAVVDRVEWSAARDAILDREKAHTREGDAIAAQLGPLHHEWIADFGVPAVE